VKSLEGHAWLARLLDPELLRADWERAPTAARAIVGIQLAALVAGTLTGLVDTIGSHRGERVIVDSLIGITLYPAIVVWLARMLLMQRRWAWTVTFWLLCVNIFFGLVALIVMPLRATTAISLAAAIPMLVLLKTRAVGDWILSRAAEQARYEPPWPPVVAVTPAASPAILTVAQHAPVATLAPSATQAPTTWIEDALKRIAGKNYPL